MQHAAQRGRVVPRQRDAQWIRRAGGVARREQALDRRLALAERPLERVAALGDSRGLGAQPPCLDA
jgi:hypothetical protein